MSSGDKQPEPLDKPQAEEVQKDIPQLGALEEDDEFEEFPVQGMHRNYTPRGWRLLIGKPLQPPLDWDDSETDLSHIVAGSSNAGNNPSGSNAGGSGVSDSLWEDNWDDDDIEDDFSKQLRCVFVYLRVFSAPCSYYLLFIRFLFCREELSKVGSTTVDTTMSG